MGAPVKMGERTDSGRGRVVEVLGVRLLDVSREDAVRLLEDWMRAPDTRTRTAFIANAHTLNLAWEDAAYRSVLNAADVVFGDGTGVRWAARLKGVRLRDNLVGTDLLPALFRATGRVGLRCFLLGGAAGTAEKAAARVAREFPGVEVVGHHAGYLDADGSRCVVEAI